MIRRFLVSLGALAVVSPLAVSVAGQAPAAARQAPATATKKATPAKTSNYTPPKTAWGDPDLHGIYNYATSTPMQRPRALGEKDVLTDDEHAALQERNLATINTDLTPRDQVGNYNDFWMDSKRKLLTEDKRTSLIIDPPNGRMPPPVPPTEAKKKEAAYLREMNARFIAGFMQDYRDGDVGNRCIIRRRNEGGGHPYLPSIYNNMAQIYQTPGYVVIYSEMIHFSRVIPLDGRPHLPQNVKTWLGDPRGHWEGNTLVVETTNFRGDDSMGHALGRTGVTWGGTDPETYTIVERWTAVAPDQLDYQVTMADPRTWTRPVTMLIPWNKTNEQIYEYACQETNYEIYHWLSSARSREAKGEVYDPVAADREANRGGGGQEER
jgi:hypothetical protein